MRTYPFVIIIGMLVMVMGCREKFPFRSLPEQMHLEKYSPNGELVSDRTITNGDAVYRRLAAIIDDEQGGWEGSSTSYKTGPYIIRSDKLIIRCYANALVIDVFDKGGWRSMKKNVPNLLQSLDLPPS